ncbi:MAG: hypothetical protein BWK73_34795 [Thiothrix lacustris]|uniref:Uncharacterized protein n=1 Tax=Thiothrix lacustris TaxID=525917 RepID=A0A1Y1QGE9_9GAMM|nr:MAG: hypothetical protein BWK73_34795 [Thiothrix lacustris]
MFELLNKQGVRSSEGFEVQWVSRYAIEYREGRNILTLKGDIGRAGARAGFILERSSINHWDNDIMKREFSDEKKQQILDNFKSALNFQNLDVF